MNYISQRLHNTTVEANTSEMSNISAVVAFAAMATISNYYDKTCPPSTIEFAKRNVRDIMFNAGASKTTVYNRTDCAFKVCATIKAKHLAHPRMEDFRQANSEEAKEAAIVGFLADMNIEGMADANRWAKTGVALTDAIRKELRTDTKAEKAAAALEVELAKAKAKTDALQQELERSNAERLAAAQAADAVAAEAAKASEAEAAAPGGDDAPAMETVVETETITLTLDVLIDFINEAADDVDCKAIILAANARLAALREAAKATEQVAA